MSKKPLRVLRLVNSFGETSPSFKQFSVPVMDKHKISFCSFYSPSTDVPNGIILYDGENTVSGYMSALAQAFKVDDYDIIHSHYAHASVFSLLSLLRKPKNLKNTVYTVHTSYPNLKFRNKILTIITFMMFRHIVFCGYSSEKSFPSYFKKFIRGKSYVIQNGVDIEQVDRMIKEGKSEPDTSKFSIISIGRLIPLKNTITLLRVLAKVSDPNIHLTLVGDGFEREMLENEVKKLNLTGQVTFTGVIPRNEVYARLSNSDLYMSASRIEGLPIATLEAMTARCLVILSDIEPHHEITTDADWIPIVDTDDIDQFANRVKTYRDLSADERRQIGDKNREVVLAHYSVTRMMKEYQDLYDNISQPE